MSNSEFESSSATTPIASSNIGFQLLKKHGWKEGTGLGISEQGRLEPVQSYLKKNKRGLGAETKKQENTGAFRNMTSNKNSGEISSQSKRKGKSKKLKKALELEQLQEKEFQQAFFREFWPDNV